MALEAPPKTVVPVSAPASAAYEARPKHRAARHFLKVREVTWMTPSTYLIYFTMDDNGQNQPVFEFEPGQFLSIFVEKDGKKTTYYLVHDDVSKAFHKNVCTETKKVTATGTNKRVDGKNQFTAKKIELAKD